MKELIDISPALRVGMGVFPGDAPFAVSQTFTIEPDCPVNVASIAMSTHCGAHVDAPLHYDPAGASIDRLDLGDFIGPARVVDARGNDPLCRFEEIAAALDGAPPRPMAWRRRALGISTCVRWVWYWPSRSLLLVSPQDFSARLSRCGEGMSL